MDIKYMLLGCETNITNDLVGMIDQKLDEIMELSNSTAEDPESLGYFDSAEHLIGLGFVVCQTHITAGYGILQIKKEKAFACGPMHACGSSVASIINDAANYWKHNNEWSLDRNSGRRKKIEIAFEKIGFPVNTDYPLSNILAELSSPQKVSFVQVMEKLREWRNALQSVT